MLKREAGVDWVYAPYAGGAPSVTALMGGHVTGVVANLSEVVAHVQSGKLRALAVGTPERMDSMKDVPTLKELGFDAVDGTIWFGFVVPAGTPPAVTERLQAGIVRALKVPAVRDKLVAQGLYPVDSPAEPFAAFLRSQGEKYERVVKKAGLKVQ
jgi:tripartite-type tricarboxylate transporter receptor subunit TctC